MRVQPTNNFDRAALIHDIEYIRGNQKQADDNMWLNLVKQNPLLLPVANATRLAFYAKDLIGYDQTPNLALYQELRDDVESNYDLGRMEFYD